MAIIIVLAGLILSISGYVQKKGSRSRAEAEIAAMSAALESYKADNGIYPRNGATDALAANRDMNASTQQYKDASLYVYTQISGDTAANRTGTGKSYMTFKSNMLLPAPPSIDPVVAIRDPFGNPYGYSTIKTAAPTGTDGYNPTFDLWSTANSGTQAEWIKNW